VAMDRFAELQVECHLTQSSDLIFMNLLFAFNFSLYNDINVL